MTKTEYLQELDKKLRQANIENHESMIEFYDELISDRTEELGDEESAVAATESVDSVVANAVLDKKSFKELFGEKVKSSRTKADRKGLGWAWIILAVIGSPLWLPILLALICVGASLYLAFWGVIAALYGCEIGFGFGSLGAVICAGGGFFGKVAIPDAIAFFGSALLLAGVFILLWKPLLLLTKAMIKLLTVSIRKIKSLLVSDKGEIEQ